MVEKIKLSMDMTMWGLIGATMIKWLPPIAAAFAIAWHVTQFYLLWKKSRAESK